MELLKTRIRAEGKVRGNDILKVDSFLNHQIDIALLNDVGRELRRRYEGCGINKILTIEASGIGVACIVAQHFDCCPVVFAKKTKTKNIAGDVYTTHVESFTHGLVYEIIVSKDFLKAEDKVLVIDDFLANGAALEGLMRLIEAAGAEMIGAGIVVEKAFQPGGDAIRARGVRVESLARVSALSEETGVTFVGE